MSKKSKKDTSWLKRVLQFLEDDGSELEPLEEEQIERERQVYSKIKKKRRKSSRARQVKLSSREKVNRERKRGSRADMISSKLFIGIAGFMILGTIAFAISFFIFPRETPQETLTRYAEHINKREFEQMYQMLDDTTKERISQETFLNRNQRIYRGIDGTDVKITVKEIKKTDEGERNVRYEMSLNTLAGKITFENTVKMVKGEERDYDIIWDDGMILPGLTEDNKVNVSTEPAQRGNIFDRNDVVLAKEVKKYEVVVDKEKLKQEEEESAIYDLAYITGEESSEIRKKLEEAEEKEEVVIAKLKEEEETARRELDNFSYVSLEEITERVYPYGKYTAHVIGYVQGITADEREKHQGEGYSSSSLIGKRGVELAFESRLRARDGHTIEILDKKGKVLKEVAKREPQNGEDIKLTIDISTQVNAFLQYQNDKSCTVAIDPMTGEVLALASTPVYNPNKFITGFTEEEWAALDEAEENPLYSRYQSVYCPGSCFKPITAAIGLDTGAFTADENFGYVGTSWQLDPSWGKRTITTLHDYGSEVTLKNALIYSDNIYFARAALKIGGDKFLEKLREIGFYEKFKFDFSLEASVATEEEDGNLNATQQLADTGYGQAQVLVNPVHMASIYSAFLNEGNMIQPYLEYQEEKTPTFAIENAFTKETADLLKEYLIAVVDHEDSTGYASKLYGKTVGGKTGTAELKMSQEDESGTELGWYNAFLLDPNGEDNILVVSMVEDVKGRGGSGYVVPRVRNILANYGTDVVRYANVYEDEDDEDVTEWGSRGSVIYSHEATTSESTETTRQTSSTEYTVGTEITTGTGTSTTGSYEESSTNTATSTNSTSAGDTTATSQVSTASTVTASSEMTTGEESTEMSEEETVTSTTADTSVEINTSEEIGTTSASGVTGENGIG